MLSIFFSYLLVLILSTSVLYFIGYLVFHLLKIHVSEFYTDLFAKLLVGCTLFVAATAIYYTKCVTVTVFFIPVLGIFAWLYSSKNKIQYDKSAIPKKTLLNSIIFLAGVVLFFCWRFGQVYNAKSDIPLLTHGDIVYYANCIDFLVHFGNENSSLDYVYGQTLGTSPYHYYHLWLGAGVSRIFSTNTLLTLILVVYAIGNILTWMGLSAIFSFFKVPKTIDVIFCFLLVFLTGIVFDMYTSVHFMQYIYVFAQNTLSLPKLFPVYIFSIASLLFFFRNKEFEGVLCLICVFISSIGTALSIIPAIFLWQLLRFIRDKKIDLNIIMVVIIFPIFIIVFYKFLTTQTNSHVSTNFMDLFEKILDYNFYRTAFNIYIGATLQFMLIFSPFLIAYFLLNNIKKINIQNWINIPEIQLLIFVYAFSLLGWALLHYKTTTTQIFSKISVTWFNILSSVFLIRIWIFFTEYKKTYLSVAFVCLVFLLSIKNSLGLYRFDYPQSIKYLQEVKMYHKDLSSNGSFIYDKIDYNFPFSYISNLAVLGNHLVYSKRRTFPLSISPYSFPVSSDARLASMQKAALENTPFWIYVEKQKEKGIFKSIPESQAQFIEEMKINYLICTKNVVLPDVLKKKVKKQIIDENTGERFLLLY